MSRKCTQYSSEFMVKVALAAIRGDETIPQLAGIYVPMMKGFGYLIAIMDWHSRKVLSWRLSITMDADSCV